MPVRGDGAGGAPASLLLELAGRGYLGGVGGGLLGGLAEGRGGGGGGGEAGDEGELGDLHL